MLWWIDGLEYVHWVVDDTFGKFSLRIKCIKWYSIFYRIFYLLIFSFPKDKKSLALGVGSHRARNKGYIIT